MHTRIQKWGNSLAIRIPASILKELKLSQGSTVNISIEGDQITINPIDHLKLDTLLDQINDQNLHHLNLDDPATGNEAW